MTEAAKLWNKVEARKAEISKAQDAIKADQAKLAADQKSLADAQEAQTALDGTKKK